MTNPTSLITGAGIRVGAAIAEHLAAHGHDLVLHYRRSQQNAEALADRLRAAHGITVTLLAADLEDAPALEAFWRGLPPVTTLIHNASHFARDRITNFTGSDLRTHLALNVEAPLLLTQGFLAQLPKGAPGNVILLGDGVKGFSISPEFFTYSVSKLGWESVINLLATACAPEIRANLIALAPTLPGEVDDAAMHARIGAHAPLQRVSNPAEVCTAIDFLLASPGVTGQVISLAGGMGLATQRPLS